MNKIRKKIDEIVETLNKWSKQYYEDDSPSVSDAQYDGLYNILVDLEKKYPNFVREDSPTQRVGGKIDNRFQKVRHNSPMLSLSNAFNEDDLIKFDKQIKDKLNFQKDIQYVIEYKIDGLSISIRYSNGNLVQAITRGDGEVGEDVTHNILQISSIPKKISFKDPLEIRGEVFMSNHTFESLNKQGIKLANPRNAAAGSLRQLDSSIAKSRNLDAFLYQIPNSKDMGFKTHYESLNFLKSQGFRINSATTITKNINEAIDVLKKLDSFRNDLDYEVDGIVLKVNDINLYEKIGYTIKAPKYMIAYKFPEKTAETKLEKIFATVGRTGRITYNAKLAPIRLAGTTVSAATLHNADYITKKNISEGDIVLVKKAGEIIPKVISVVKKNNTHKWVEDKYCPSCFSKLIRIEGEVDQYCLNELCPEKIQSKFEHFVSRGAMNIDGVSSEILRTFIKKGFITNIPSIYKLSFYKDKLISLPGFKIKSINKILNSIEKSKNRSLDKFLFALGIRHLGEKNSKLLVKQFGNLENIMMAKIDEIENIKDLGPKVAESVVSYFQDSKNIEIIHELISLGLDFKVENNNISNLFKNKTFVITGKLSKSRNYFKKIIENNNGNVSGSISKNTSYLLIGENSGSKLEKAKSLNINIINEEQFNKILKRGNNG